MSLSEGKMFTIEALNRIEGFVWPEGAEFASADDGGVIHLYTSNTLDGSGRYVCSAYVIRNNTQVMSSITRNEFELIGGFVRHDGDGVPTINPGAVIDVIYCDGVVVNAVTSRDVKDDDSADSWVHVKEWRYHKPQKQEVKPDPESNASDQSESQDGIESLISKHKAVKEIARLARIELERVEAAEHSLMLSIEAWAESHGFDIRVLSESEEKPELVITDWRDLQAGDVVEVREMAVVDGFIGCVGVVKRININAEHGPLLVKFDNGEEWWVKKWKFICRPEKK